MVIADYAIDEPVTCEKWIFHAAVKKNVYCKWVWLVHRGWQATVSYDTIFITVDIL